MKFGESFAQLLGLCQCCLKCGKVTLAVCRLALFLSFAIVKIVRHNELIGVSFLPYNLLVEIREVASNIGHEHVLDPSKLIRNERDLLARIESVNEIMEKGRATAT